MNRSDRYRLVRASRPAALAALLLALAACAEQASPEPAGALPVPTTAVRAVDLPDLTGFDSAAAEQVRAAHEQAAALAQAPEVDPLRLGQAYGELGTILLAYDRSESETALTNAAALVPDDARWPYYLGRFHQRNGQYAAAARFFERVLALQPRDIPTHVRLAQVHRASGGAAAEAIRLLDETIALDPSCGLCHFLLGQLLAEQAGDAAAVAASIAHFETTLRLQPEASTVHAALAAAYRRQGDLARAEEHARRLGQVWPTILDPLDARLTTLRQGYFSALQQGEEAMRSGDRQAAVERYEQAVAANPGDATASMLLGLARAEAGDLAGGIGDVRRARDLAPRNATILGAFGDLLARAGRLAEAEASFSAAVAADPREAEVRFAFAELLRRSDRCADAVPHYGVATDIQPRRQIAYVRRAMCLARLGRHAEALSLIESAYAGSPADADLTNALARLLSASPDDAVRDGARALALIEARAEAGAESRSESPVEAMSTTDLLETHAMALAEAGRFDDAIRVQGRAIDLARQQGFAAWTTAMEANLGRYQRGEPNREPWPDALVLQ